jgi:hypothetical protein
VNVVCDFDVSSSSSSSSRTPSTTSFGSAHVLLLSLLLFIQKIAFDNDSDPPSKNNHTPHNPNAAGPAPQGAVAAGSARKPPPMAVPAMSAACDFTVVVAEVVVGVVDMVVGLELEYILVVVSVGTSMSMPMSSSRRRCRWSAQQLKIVPLWLRVADAFFQLKVVSACRCRHLLLPTLLRLLRQEVVLVLVL